jgi:hypothetical protein
LVDVSAEAINNLLLDKKLTLDEGQTAAREIIITVLIEDELGGENAFACRKEKKGGFRSVAVIGT